MKFKILGTDIELNWQHFAIYIIALILYCIVGLGIGTLSWAVFNQQLGISLREYLVYFQLDPLAKVLASLSPIIIGLLALQLARAFKIDRTEVFGRSVGTAFFITYVILWLIGKLIIILLNMGLKITIASTLAGISGFILSAMGLYLWIRILIKPEKEKAMDAGGIALALGIAIFLLDQVFQFMQRYYQGQIYAYIPYVGDISFILSVALLGFIVVYNCKGRKVDDWAYVFAICFMLPTLINLVTALWFTMIEFVTDIRYRMVLPSFAGLDLLIWYFFQFLLNAVELILLFNLAQIKFPDNSTKDKKQ